MKQRYPDGQISPDASAARRQVAGDIRQLRQELNMTQQDLAVLSGTKKSNISRMESGNYNPSLDFLVKVASSLGRHIEIKIE